MTLIHLLATQIGCGTWARLLDTTIVLCLNNVSNKKNKGLQSDFQGSPSSAVCEHILQSLSWIEKILIISAIYARLKTFQNCIKIDHWCWNLNCFEVKYLSYLICWYFIVVFLISILYFMSFYLKINPKWLHLWAIWKQDDSSHYYYYIILQNLKSRKVGAHFAHFETHWNASTSHKLQKQYYTTVSSLHSCFESL